MCGATSGPVSEGRTVLQTIIFGRYIRDVDRVLDIVSRAGYAGVELFQHPKNIKVAGAEDPITCAELARRLKLRGLKLVGLSGGSLQDRIQFVSGANRFLQEERQKPWNRRLYLYVDDLDELSLVLKGRSLLDWAKELGLSIAIHPHAFTGHGSMELMIGYALQDESRLLDRDNVFLLPDTAHMLISGEPPDAWLEALIGTEDSKEVEALRRRANNTKVIGVHLKDWSSAFGRAAITYTRGFTELGTGLVPLNNVAQAMKSAYNKGWNGWTVIEQDYSGRGVIESIARDTNWLADQSLTIKRVSPRDLGEEPETKPLVAGATKQDSNHFDLFQAAVRKASSRPLPEFYGALAVAASKLFAAPAAGVWLYSQERTWRRDAPSNERGWANLMGSAVKDVPDYEGKIEGSTRIDGPDHMQRVLSSLEPALIPFSALKGIWRDWALSTRRAAGSKHEKLNLLAIPIADRFNPHLLRLLITVLVGGAEAKRRCNSLFDGIESEVAEAVDSALVAHISAAKGRISQIDVDRCTVSDYSHEVSDCIEASLPCHRASLFIGTRDNRLTCRTPEKITWNRGYAGVGEEFYSPDDKRSTTECWQSGRTLFRWSTGQNAKTENEPAPERGSAPSACLIAPLWSADRPAQVLGVISCSDRLRLREDGTRLVRSFTDDDAAVLAAVLESCSLAFHLLVDRERQSIRTAIQRRSISSRWFQPLRKCSTKLNGVIRELQESDALSALQFVQILDCHALLRQAELLSDPFYQESRSEVNDHPDAEGRGSILFLGREFAEPDMPLTPLLPTWRKGLEDKGFAVYIAETWSEAVRYLYDTRFDLAIIDTLISRDHVTETDEGLVTLICRTHGLSRLPIIALCESVEDTNRLVADYQRSLQRARPAGRPRHKDSMKAKVWWTLGTDSLRELAEKARELRDASEPEHVPLLDMEPNDACYYVFDARYHRQCPARAYFEVCSEHEARRLFVEPATDGSDWECKEEFLEQFRPGRVPNRVLKLVTFDRETWQHEVLGLLFVGDSTKEKYWETTFFEVRPDLRSGVRNRRYSHIGRIMMARLLRERIRQQLAAYPEEGFADIEYGGRWLDRSCAAAALPYMNRYGFQQAGDGSVRIAANDALRLLRAVANPWPYVRVERGHRDIHYHEKPDL